MFNVKRMKLFTEVVNTSWDLGVCEIEISHPEKELTLEEQQEKIEACTQLKEKYSSVLDQALINHPDAEQCLQKAVKTARIGGEYAVCQSRTWKQGFFHWEICGGSKSAQQLFDDLEDETINCAYKNSSID